MCSIIRLSIICIEKSSKIVNKQVNFRIHRKTYVKITREILRKLFANVMHFISNTFVEINNIILF